MYGEGQQRVCVDGNNREYGVEGQERVWRRADVVNDEKTIQ